MPYDRFGRPDWDSFYLAQAYLIAQKSLDPSTKHGCLIVPKGHRPPVSQGFNGPIRGMDDSKLPLDSRPAKYAMMIHSEENSILSYSGSHSDIIGSTIYITGYPCNTCLRMIIQKGIKRVVYGNVTYHMMDNEDENAKSCRKLLIEQSGISVEEGNLEIVPEILMQTLVMFRKYQNLAVLRNAQHTS